MAEATDGATRGPDAAALPLLDVRHLSRHYALPRESLWRAPRVVKALDDVSFTLRAGSSVGVVGESGSGKSTLARLVMALEPPTTGEVRFDGHDLASLSPAALKRARAGFQMVFQDPFGSLDPRQTVGRIVAEPLAAQGRDAATRRDTAAAMLEAVGLNAADVERYPHEFSGGQRQRIAIARALVTHPKLIVADEPVSALDVSVQAQVLNLMQTLQETRGLSYLFISHDLAVVDLVCDDVLVLYQGRLVERGNPDVLFRAAAHPYTRQLVAAAPRAAGVAPEAVRDGSAAPSTVAEGMPAAIDAPAPAAPSGGCAFAPRCPAQLPLCRSTTPPWVALDGGHGAACHRAHEVAAGAVAVVAAPRARRRRGTTIAPDARAASAAR